jgi:membrane-bound lytic murein transglycosylase F
MGVQIIGVVFVYLMLLFPRVEREISATYSINSKKYQLPNIETNYLFHGRPVIDRVTRQSIENYGSIIARYSKQYKLDWRLILAIIRQESIFKQNAVSSRGAYGLMQIIPDTQFLLVETLGIPDALQPKYNIRAGIYHFNFLLRSIEADTDEDRINLALAAYNAGLGRVYDAQDICVYLGLNPRSWNSVRDILPFLAKRNATLHARVWQQGMPPSGYLNRWKETTKYVEGVNFYYSRYLEVM